MQIKSRASAAVHVLDKTTQLLMSEMIDKEEKESNIVYKFHAPKAIQPANCSSRDVRPVGYDL